MELPGSDNGRLFFEWHEFCFSALSKASGIVGRQQSYEWLILLSI
jgi:hypothetical protein